MDGPYQGLFPKCRSAPEVWTVQNPWCDGFILSLLIPKQIMFQNIALTVAAQRIYVYPGCRDEAS